MKYPNTYPNELTDKVLDYYHEHGLWEARKIEERWKIKEEELWKQYAQKHNLRTAIDEKKFSVVLHFKEIL